jgi:hypothetical protein
VFFGKRILSLFCDRVEYFHLQHVLYCTRKTLLFWQTDYVTVLWNALSVNYGIFCQAIKVHLLNTCHFMKTFCIVSKNNNRHHSINTYLRVKSLWSFYNFHALIKKWVSISFLFIYTHTYLTNFKNITNDIYWSIRSVKIWYNYENNMNK